MSISGSERVLSAKRVVHREEVVIKSQADSMRSVLRLHHLEKGSVLMVWADARIAML